MAQIRESNEQFKTYRKLVANARMQANEERVMQLFGADAGPSLVPLSRAIAR